MSEVPQHILEWRRKTGADRWDEVWDGVLHMVPGPDLDHQRLEAGLLAWLHRYWLPGGPGREVLPDANLSRPRIPDWTKDYRQPDLMLVTSASTHVDRGTHFEGGPDAVVEIRSRDDESYDKLPFYAAVGCREVWVIDRDPMRVELFAVGTGEPVRQRPHAAGWHRSALGVELRADGERLRVRLAGDEASQAALP